MRELLTPVGSDDARSLLSTFASFMTRLSENGSFANTPPNTSFGHCDYALEHAILKPEKGKRPCSIIFANK